MALSERQMLAMRWLKGHVGGRLDRDVVLEMTKLSEAEYEDLIEMLAKKGCAEKIDPSENVRFTSGLLVSSKIVKLVEEVDRPPPKDYWLEFQTWFRSNRFCVPALLVVYTVTFLATCCGILAYCFTFWGN